jgi:cytochrome P450
MQELSFKCPLTSKIAPKSYVRPLEFIPERWYSSPELIKNKSAFIPFALGFWGCIGKPLAYMELRAVIARLIMSFDIAFAPGEDGSKLLNESEDGFTMVVADMYLLLTPRR